MTWPEWTSPDGRIRLINADCLEVLPALEGVDAVVTDPPYGSRTNADYTRFSGSGRGRYEYSELRVCHDPIAGDDVDFDPSPWLSLGDCIFWGANHFSNRLPKGAMLVWDKRNDKGGALLADAEMAWLSRGIGVYIFDHCWQGFARASEAGKFYHPSQKPVALMEWCLSRLAHCNTILDPFAGSFTTAIACHRTNRRCIAIEKERKYFDIGVKRMQAEIARTALIEEACA